MTRYDLVSPRPRKDGKIFWQKIGAAFPSDKGGYSLVFDALPLADAEGRVAVMMWEAKPREERSDRRSDYDQGGTGGAGDSIDQDAIPF